MDVASDPLLGLENLGRRLILANTSLDSTASYVCRASNAAGRTEFSHELIVYDESECIVCDYSFLNTVNRSSYEKSRFAVLVENSAMNSGVFHSSCGYVISLLSE